MKILIISNNEISYNPRLLKAADFFSDNNDEVVVFNPLTGLASDEVYQSTIRGKKWRVIENDIRKNSLKGYLNWFYVSLAHTSLKFLYNNFKVQFAFKYLFNKGLIGNKINLKEKFDYILVNLVDNLPYAVKIKRSAGSKIIYDSQEYFVGQFKKYESFRLEWVIKSEKAFFKDVDILLTTTDVMKDRLLSDYGLSIPSFRVRNVPSKRMLQIHPVKNEDDGNVYLVWHGMAIYLNNARGVHIILKAIAKCTSNVKLVLQGNINEEQLAILNAYISDLKLHEKVVVAPAADPYAIVDSLVRYDIGILSEIPEEDNQRLTSSNKLFDYLNAGLAVIVPDLEGITETVRTHALGLIYEPGNIDELARSIDKLAGDRTMLNELKTKAKEISSQELYWEHDFTPVWQLMKAI